MNTLELADFLMAHAKKLTTFLSNNEVPFILAATELHRLSAIEQAATALIKCKGRYHAEQNTKALAEALSIPLPLPASDHPAEQSRAEDLLVRALAALEYHTQQTRPVTESEAIISVIKDYFSKQPDSENISALAFRSNSVRNRHDIEEVTAPAQHRFSAIELQARSFGIPEPFTELINPAHPKPFTRSQALDWLVENVKVWGEFPVTKIPGWKFSLRNDSVEFLLAVLINKVDAFEITKKDWQAAQAGIDRKAAEIGIPVPATDSITRDKALAWLVKNVTVWPHGPGRLCADDVRRSAESCPGWEWAPTAANWLFMAKGRIGLSVCEWADAQPQPASETKADAKPFTSTQALGWLAENMKVWGELPSTKIPGWDFYFNTESRMVGLANPLNAFEITEYYWKEIQTDSSGKTAADR